MFQVLDTFTSSIKHFLCTDIKTKCVSVPKGCHGHDHMIVGFTTLMQSAPIITKVVRSLLMARCTRDNIMWSSLSVTGLWLSMARCTRYNIMWSSLSVTGRWFSMARCTLYNIMWSSLSVTGRWFSPGIQVSYTNRTDPHYRTENMLKVA